MMLLDAGVPGADPYSFIQWGVLGIVLIMLLTGWLWAKPSVDEIRARHVEDRKLWEEQVIPLLKDILAELKRRP